MPVGLVEKLVSERGYGFLIADGETKTLWFHTKSLSNADIADLRVGDRCEFKVGTKNGRPVATNIYVDLPDEANRVCGVIESVCGSFGYIRAEGHKIFLRCKQCNFFCDERCVGQAVSFIPADNGGVNAVCAARVRLET
jgi:cold shock CspA family protein